MSKVWVLMQFDEEHNGGHVVAIFDNIPPISKLKAFVPTSFDDHDVMKLIDYREHKMYMLRQRTMYKVSELRRVRD